MKQNDKAKDKKIVGSCVYTQCWYRSVQAGVEGVEGVEGEKSA